MLHQTAQWCFQQDTIVHHKWWDNPTIQHKLQDNPAPHHYLQEHPTFNWKILQYPCSIKKFGNGKITRLCQGPFVLDPGITMPIYGKHTTMSMTCHKYGRETDFTHKREVSNMIRHDHSLFWSIQVSEPRRIATNLRSSFSGPRGNVASGWLGAHMEATPPCKQNKPQVWFVKALTVQIHHRPQFPIS